MTMDLEAEIQVCNLLYYLLIARGQSKDSANMMVLLWVRLFFLIIIIDMNERENINWRGIWKNPDKKEREATIVGTREVGDYENDSEIPKDRS